MTRHTEREVDNDVTWREFGVQVAAFIWEVRDWYNLH